MKCSNKQCNREIEDFASDNVDSEGNLYCMDCVAKLQLLFEQGDLDGFEI